MSISISPEEIARWDAIAAELRERREAREREAQRRQALADPLRANELRALEAKADEHREVMHRLMAQAGEELRTLDVHEAAAFDREQAALDGIKREISKIVRGW